MDGIALSGAQGTRPALPPEAPLEMPVQDLGTRPVPRVPSLSSPRFMALRRLFVLGGAILMTAFAGREMHLVLGVNGITTLELVILPLFVSLFAWIALALISAVCGFVAMLAGGGRRLDLPAGTLPELTSRTALLMPTYNELPARVAAAVQVIHEDLQRLGLGTRFDLFILSDTTDPDIWIAEEAAFLRLRASCAADARIFYRRRPKNIERKAGNVAEWVRRFGGAYPQMLVLDADSVMTGECILHLASALERHPDIGLIQTLPVIVGGETLLARLQQFAGRVYGPVIAQGLAWWHGAEGNYWGHNAIIRTRVFAAHAGLPALRGRKPFGGHIMSHDFVEAALLRRAGWGVHMMPALRGSYEESPATLPDLAVRDRRWCQGNLQHAAVLPTRGLHWVSRLHLLMGIGSYLTAPLWLLFLMAGILVSLQHRFVLPDYFPAGPSLFPQWPAVDPVRSMWLFVATLGVLLGPKLLAFAALLVDGDQRRACGGGLRLTAGLLTETLISGLVAPITMLTQTGAVFSILAGRDGGWSPQRRGDADIPFLAIVRFYLPHTLIGVGFAAISWMISRELLLWMSPITIGLCLAIPIVHLTGIEGPGRGLRRMGILSTPEETAAPPVVARAAALREASIETAMDAFRRLHDDPQLLEAHLSMLPPPRRPGQDPIDPATVLGLAKLAEAGGPAAAAAALTRQERAAVLSDWRGIALGVALYQRQNSLDSA